MMQRPYLPCKKPNALEIVSPTAPKMSPAGSSPSLPCAATPKSSAVGSRSSDGGHSKQALADSQKTVAISQQPLAAFPTTSHNNKGYFG